MAKKNIFPKIEIGSKAFSHDAILQHQKILKQHESQLNKRFVTNVARFKGISFLPSFLLRTLNDALSEPSKNLSSLQKTLLASWHKSGLGKRQAIKQLETFHKMSKKTLPLLNQKYFEVATDKLDELFLKDIRDTNWNPYLKSKPISAIRLRRALKKNKTDDLTKEEKIFLTSAFDLREDQVNDALKAARLRGIGEYLGIKPPASEPEPQVKVQFYNFTGRITRWRIRKSSDHVGGNADPVFIIQTFYNSPNFMGSGGIQCAGTRILRLGDDVPASDNWSNYDDWASLLSELSTCPIVGSAFANLLVPPNIVDEMQTACNPASLTVIVNAFEDDDWISEDTENYIDFATDVAAQIGLIAGGLPATVSSIISLSWDILCKLDSLDENDRFRPRVWMLPEDQIADQPVNDFIKSLRLFEIDGENDWEIEVKMTVTDPVFQIS